MKAFVTDGDQRSALAITRSLGRRGVRVLVGEQQPVCLASSSRYCAGHVTYPSPLHEPAAFRRFLPDFLRREGIDVLVPVADVTTSLVCLEQEGLRRHAAVAVPPGDAFERMADKAAALQEAAARGIPVPPTHVLGGRAGLRAAAGQVGFPAVVKSFRSRVPDAGRWVATGVHYAASAADLWRLYEDSVVLASHPSLIQPRIEGQGVGLFALFDHGRMLATFAHRRLREKPPSGGVSVLCESVPVEPEMEADAARLLGPLGWHGVAMLEYKRERRGGQRYLIEVNGRYWGSLQLAIDAGVDFPWLAFQLALGRRPEAPAAYRVGIRNRWLLGDLDHLLSRLFDRRAEAWLPAGAPPPWRAVLDFLRCARPGLRDQVLSADDRGPFLYELRRYAASLSASLGQRARRRAARARLHGARLARRWIPA